MTNTFALKKPVQHKKTQYHPQARQIEEFAKEAIEQYGPVNLFTLTNFVSFKKRVGVSDYELKDVLSDTVFAIDTDVENNPMVSLVNSSSEPLLPCYNSDLEYADAYYRLYAQYLAFLGRSPIYPISDTVWEDDKRRTFNPKAYKLGENTEVVITELIDILDSYGPITPLALAYLYNTAKERENYLKMGTVISLIDVSQKRLKMKFFTLSPNGAMASISTWANEANGDKVLLRSFDNYILPFYDLYFKLELLKANPDLASIPESWINKALAGK